MRPGKDIPNEFVVLSKMNRLVGTMDRKDEDGLQRIMMYLAERYPYAFQKAMKHLRANGYDWKASA